MILFDAEASNNSIRLHAHNYVKFFGKFHQNDDPIFDVPASPCGCAAPPPAMRVQARSIGIHTNFIWLYAPHNYVKFFEVNFTHQSDDDDSYLMPLYSLADGEGAE